MAEKNLVCFSLVLLSAAVALLAGHAHGADICAKADYVPLCRSMVKGATDPVAALKVAIGRLIFETKRAKEASAKSGKSQSVDVCKENFADAISDLKTSLNYLKSKDKHSLNIELSAALTDYVTCDDAVAEGGVVGRAAGILKTDTMLRHMASNCLYLSSLA